MARPLSLVLLVAVHGVAVAALLGLLAAGAALGVRLVGHVLGDLKGGAAEGAHRLEDKTGLKIEIAKVQQIAYR